MLGISRLQRYSPDLSAGRLVGRDFVDWIDLIDFTDEEWLDLAVGLSIESPGASAMPILLGFIERLTSRRVKARNDSRLPVLKIKSPRH